MCTYYVPTYLPKYNICFLFAAESLQYLYSLLTRHAYPYVWIKVIFSGTQSVAVHSHI